MPSSASSRRPSAAASTPNAHRTIPNRSGRDSPDLDDSDSFTTPGRDSLSNLAVPGQFNTSTPSRQRKQRHTPQKWTENDVHRLVDLVTQPEYHSLLPNGRHSTSDSGGSTITKAVLCRQICRELWPNRPEDSSPVERIKSKIVQLHKQYKQKLATMGETGQGLLLEDIRPDTRVHRERQAVIQSLPWFEKWHRVALDRGSSDPTHVLTGGNGESGSSSQSPSIPERLELESHLRESGPPTQTQSVIDPRLRELMNSDHETTVTGRGIPTLTATSQTQDTEDALASNVLGGGDSSRAGRHKSVLGASTFLANNSLDDSSDESDGGVEVVQQPPTIVEDDDAPSSSSRSKKDKGKGKSKEDDRPAKSAIKRNAAREGISSSLIEIEDKKNQRAEKLDKEKTERLNLALQYKLEKRKLEVKEKELEAKEREREHERQMELEKLRKQGEIQTLQTLMQMQMHQPDRERVIRLAPSPSPEPPASKRARNKSPPTEMTIVTRSKSPQAQPSKTKSTTKRIDTFNFSD